jgi:DNA replication ATP-dependent helicase Dna2
MNVSLFKRLAEAHPEAVACLNSQYRMNEEVMSLSNQLIYDNRLLCGNEMVANGRINLPSQHLFLEQFNQSTLHCELSRVKSVHYSWTVKQSENAEGNGSFSWLTYCLDPNNCVVFLDTDTVVAHGIESSTDQVILTNEELTISDDRTSCSNSHGLINPLEILVIKLILDSLEICGVDLTGVGVVTPYRAQVRALESALRMRNVWQHNGHKSQRLSAMPVVSTVDKFQGRDMDIIIFSTVRCNPHGLVRIILILIIVTTHESCPFRSVIFFVIGEESMWQ